MRRPRLLFALALAASLAAAGTAQAGLGDDVPSCYAASGIHPVDGRGYSRLLYVLIDQTVGWNRDLESEIMDGLNQNLAPGTKFVVAQFSAFAAGRYLRVLHTGVIEAPLAAAQVGGTPIAAAKLLNTCLAGQLPFAAKLADDAAVAALDGSSATLANSDILFALDDVATAIAADPAPARLLLLASDGLENSAVTSFYSHGRPRDIDPAREMKRAAAAGLVGNFAGAKVFVIGGALSPSDADGAPGPAGRDYRSPQMLRHLATFWSLYFRGAHAELAAFGEPALLQPVRF